jgi:putative ABC transport system substrate-binding protein
MFSIRRNSWIFRNCQNCGRLLHRPVSAMDVGAVQSTKVELMLNLKTAKTFGIAVPLPLLGRVDKVIE